MKHLSLSLLLALSACDVAVAVHNKMAEEAEANAAAEVAEKPVAVAAEAPPAEVKPAAEVKPTVEAVAFDLETVSFLVKKGKVKDAKALEKQINNPKEKINNVDVDGDGKVDRIQVVEIRGEAGVVVFELRAIPSSSKDKDAAVVIAVLDFTPDKVSKELVVKTTYAPIVVGHETHVYTHVVPIEVKGDAVVVVHASPFYGWLFTASRPAYVGVFVYEVAPPPVIVIEAGCWPPGHCKHHDHHDHHDHGHPKHHKHKGKHKHGWH